MGCGKSSVGIRLAQELEKEFLDTDQWIEQKEKTTISHIFERRGEEAFRRMETDCLKELLKEEREGILSVGGGLPIREVNRELLRQIGMVVFLEASADTIYERVKGDTKRPLLKTANPKAKIEEMLVQRTPLYQAAADYIIKVDGKSFEAIINEILEMVPFSKLERNAQ